MVSAKFGKRSAGRMGFAAHAYQNRKAAEAFAVAMASRILCIGGMKMVSYRVLKARIDRDKAKKEARRAALREKYDCLEKVFTLRHYVRSMRKCRKGVSFKLSVQNYSARPFRMMEDDCESMLRGVAPPLATGKKEVIRERGKERIITPIKIRDRMNQRVLCDYALNPMIHRRLIYDNGASMKDKGVSFARKRLNRMLEKAKYLWGNQFYVMIFDFRKFFDSIPHRLCWQELRKAFRDERLADLTMQIIEGYQMMEAGKARDVERMEMLKRHEGYGVCLGSHVSQLMALCVPNFLDHYVKDVRRVKFYIRYMDDGIILHQDKAFLKQLLRDMVRVCAENGLNLNWTKTHIIPVRLGFTFLKIRYRIVDRKTVRKLSRSTVVRMRRRLNRFGGLVAQGRMTMSMVRDSLQSWLGHTKMAMAFRQRKRMKQIYRSIFREGAAA